MEEGSGLDQSVMRFRINFPQKVLAFFVALAFLALSITIIQTNKSSLVDARHLTAAEAPAASIIFTQRETLVYTIRLSQWLDLHVTRRDVQIARALLAQELEDTNMMVHQLESLNESKNEFISNISHELRTPLTSIIGYVDLLSSTVEPGANPAMDNSFKALDRNASILLSLVQSLLSLSQLESPNNKFALKPVALISIIEDAIFLMQTSIENKNLSVQFTHDETDSFFVTGEAGLLSQMVINLVANAVKFSHPAKVLEISLRRHPHADSAGNVVLTIRDHGIGIPEEEIDHLFERFYRASNAVDQQIQGTGLGLAIVAKVAEIHGAKIEVNSQLGDGTSITVEFPDGLRKTQALIENRKYSLLAEASQNIQQGDLEELRSKLHEYGGALGFYDFAEIGEELLIFSRSLNGQSGDADTSVLQRRDDLIAKMRKLLPSTETGDENV